MLVDLPRPDDFIDLAKRGFYVYDWSDIHKVQRSETNCYELIAVPTIPINLKNTSGILNEILRLSPILDLSFSSAKYIGDF